MKVLITGAVGQVGLELQQSVPPGWHLICLQHGSSASGHRGLDITDEAAIVACLEHHRPELVVNAAAYTQVDKAESEPDKAFAVNRDGAAKLARATMRRAIRFIQLSTDFVFDGRKSTPYLPADPGAPLGVYGASKWEGENKVTEITNGAALIVRSAWIYSRHGSNFVATILRLLRERDELGIVADQVGTPTWARSLARAIWAAASRPQLQGIYHWTDAGIASWFDFAMAIQDEAMALGLVNGGVPIAPIRTEDYPTPARRPSYSVLDKTSAWKDFSLTPVHWRDSLREMLGEMASTP